MRAFSLLLCSLALTPLSMLGGCIIVEKGGAFGDGPGMGCDADGPGDDDDSGDSGGENSGENSGDSGGDTGQGEAAQSTWTWDPGTLAPGETRIVSVTAEPTFDYASVTDVQIYGEAGICTFEAGADGLSVVVSVAQDAGEGTLGAVLILADGEAIWQEDALVVHAPDASGDAGADGTGAGSSGSGAEAASGCGD